MAEPTPLQRRTAELREMHLRNECGSLVATLAQVMAERDALREVVEAMQKQLDAMNGKASGE